MRIRDVAIVAFRVVAIYMVAQGILVAAQIGPMWLGTHHSSNESFGALLVLSILAPMLAGFILWLMAPFLANLAARDTSQIANAVGLTVQDLTQSAFVVVGVFIFVMTLPDLIRSFVIYADRPGSLEISYGLALLLRCLLAVALVLGARWAARTLLWIRYARTSK